MADVAVTRVIEVDVKASKSAADEIKRIAAGVGGLEDIAKKNQGVLSDFFSNVAASAKAAVGAFAMFKAAQVFGEVVAVINSANDQAKVLIERMRLITKSSDDTNIAFSEMVRIARDQGRELDSVAKLYEKVTRNSEQLGITQRAASLITEGFAASLRLSGANTQEANAAMVQFSQALASGKLGGDEFRSMMENNSVFMNELAKALHTTMGGLRDMSKEGKLDAETLRNAMLELGEDGKTMLQRLIEKAAELPMTFSQASEGSKAALVDLLEALQGTAEKSEGFFTRMAKAVTNAMSAAARTVREEALIRQRMEEFDTGKFVRNLSGTDGDPAAHAVELMERRSKAMERIKALQESIDKAQEDPRKKNLIEQILGPGQSSIDQWSAGLRRAKGEVQALDELLSQIANKDSGDTIGGLKAGKPTNVAKPKKTGHTEKDLVKEMLEYFTVAEDTLEDKVEGIGKWMRKFEQYTDKLALHTPPGYTVEQIQAAIRTARASAQHMDDLDEQQEATKRIKKFWETVRKENEKEAKHTQERIEHYRKEYQHLNPLYDLEVQKDELKKLMMDPAVSDKDADMLLKLYNELPLKMAKALMGVKEVVKDSGEQIADAFKNSTDRMLDNLLQFNKSGKEIVFDFVTDFLRQVAKMELSKQMQPAVSAVGSAVKDFFVNLFKSADGSAFGPGGVRMFAAGGVVNEPTGFTYSGGHGVMGEAGPEAIVPLRRGSDGKLGIGQSPVTVNVINNGSGKARTEESKDANGHRQVSVIIEDIVENSIGSGRFDKVMNHSFGASRKGK